MDIIGVIKSIENLIDLISKKGDTISNKKIKAKAEEWVSNFSNSLSNILSPYPDAIESLEYLIDSVSNQRLIKKKWIRSLRTILKALKNMSFSPKKQIIIFDPNKPFTAYQILKRLFAVVKKEVLIYDGYIEEGTLDILASVPKEVKIKILTNNVYGKFLKELPKFIKEFPECEVRKSPVVHDRFFFLDGVCFVSGTSLHALGGKKASHIFEISKDIATILRKHFESTWDRANKIP